MSTSESHNNDDVITENTTITQDEAQMEQNVSEPQEDETELLLVKKPGKKKLKKEKVPLKENVRLVQLVRCMRCLYDPQHPRHQDTEVCKDLWDIIGKSMDLPGNTCAQNWKKLIGKFTKSKYKNRDYKELKWLLKYISKDEVESEISDTDRPKKNIKCNVEVEFLHDVDCQCNTATLAHPMQKSLAEIATILKKLPQEQQNLAKLEIFEITNKFDLQKSTELSVSEIKIEFDSDE